MEDNSLKKLNDKEFFISYLKVLFGAIPYIGNALNEAVFELRSRVKQNRINHFIVEFTEYIQGFNLNEGSLRNIRSEEFGDIFESIIKKVSENRNEDKIQRFKKILAKQIVLPEQTDFVETYLDLVNKLSEKQIEILFKHKEYQMEISINNAKQADVIHERDELTTQLREAQIIRTGSYTAQEQESDMKQKGKIDEVELRLKQIQEKATKLLIFRGHEFYNLPKGEYIFYLQDLASKALLSETGGGQHGYEPLKYMSITEFGANFLEFISEAEPTKRLIQQE